MYIRRRNRRIYLRNFPPHFSRKTRMKIAVMLIIALVAYVGIMSLMFLRQISTEMARSDAIDMVILDINTSINERMKSEDISYDRFVTLEKDDNGNISAIKTNMAEINTLSSELLADIIGKGDRRVMEMSIPLGNLLGNSLLLGKGPDIPMDIIMLTSSRVEFRNDLVSAGINQTKHKIIFELIVEIDVLLPWDIESTTVKNEVLIAETVIVGTVPNTYISME